VKLSAMRVYQVLRQDNCEDRYQQLQQPDDQCGDGKLGGVHLYGGSLLALLD
jgi:hypothetical protein